MNKHTPKAQSDSDTCITDICKHLKLRDQRMIQQMKEYGRRINTRTVIPAIVVSSGLSELLK